MAITGAIGLAAAIGPRLVVGALGGWLAVHVLALPASGFVAVVAASLVVHGLVVAGAIRLGSWSR